MKKEHETLLADFLAEEKLRGTTEKGRIMLRSRAARLLDYLDNQSLEVREVGTREALAYQGWLIEGGKRDGGAYKNSTVLTYVKGAACLYEYLRRNGKVPCNPFREVRRVRAEKTLPRDLPKEGELCAFLEDLADWEGAGGLKKQVTRYKTHVMAELQYATGLRIGEVASLRPEDIDFSKGTVNLKEGKGGTSRICYLNEYARDILRIYLDSMREATFTAWHWNNGHLLFGTPWAALEKLVNKTLKEVSAARGMPPFTSHRFRHCLGHHLLRAGCNIRYIQQILGHKALRNTEIYTKVDGEDLKNVLDACHPRRPRKAPSWA